MILLAEDSEDDVFMLRRAFKTAAIADDMHVASDGKKAIEYLDPSGPFADRAKAPLPRFVLLDIQMPLFTGLEVLEWIRGTGAYKRLPVIMLTSSSQPDDIRRAYDLGANSYLVKPSNLQQLALMAAALKEYWIDLNQPAPKD